MFKQLSHFFTPREHINKEKQSFQLVFIFRMKQILKGIGIWTLHLFIILESIFLIDDEMLRPQKAISGQAAYNLDQTLFTKYKFSVDQLMELAGLSVAICSARQG